MKKTYGHFDDKNREYVITDPATPFPWINYLGNEDFFSLISNTAGGYSFYKGCQIPPHHALPATMTYRWTTAADTFILRTETLCGVPAGSRARPHSTVMSAAMG